MTNAFMVPEACAATRRVSGIAAPRTRPDPFRRLQIRHCPTDGVSVITLHIAAVLFSDSAQRERMARGAISLQHAVAVAER